MTNITKEVHRYLDQDASLRLDLARNLINMRALASYIHKQLHLTASVDSIISAIRRYEIDSSHEKRFGKALSVIKNGKISTKNHISIIELVKDSSVQQLLPKLFSHIEYARGEVLRIIQAEELIKVVVDQKNVPSVLDIFPKGKVKDIKRSLAEINLHLPPVSSKVPGILAILGTELANNGVNTVETMSCVPEVIWFIDEKNLLKAHETFLNLISSIKS